MKRTLALVAMLLVAVAGTGAWLFTRGDDATTVQQRTATVSSETVKQTVAASGTIEPARTADLDFSVSGTVKAVYVAEGDRVTKGQALARVSDTALVAARTAAASTLTAARTQLDTDTDDDADDIQLAADQTSVVSARASLVDARQAVREATLRATIAGTVSSLDLAVGDVVGSSSSGGGASAGSTGVSNAADTTSTTAVSIVSTRSFIVDATVASSDVSQLKTGMQATVTATGSTAAIYGTVSEVGAVSQTSSSGAAVFPVTIAVTGAQKDLYAGTSADATITVKQTAGVLTVATQAIHSDGDTTYVEKLVDGKSVKTTVTLGTAYGPTTQIKKGLKSGDTVVLQTFTAPTGGTGGSTGEGGQQGGFPGGTGGTGNFPGGGQGFPGAP